MFMQEGKNVQFPEKYRYWSEASIWRKILFYIILN